MQWQDADCQSSCCSSQSLRTLQFKSKNYHKSAKIVENEISFVKAQLSLTKVLFMIFLKSMCLNI